MSVFSYARDQWWYKHETDLRWNHTRNRNTMPRNNSKSRYKYAGPSDPIEILRQIDGRVQLEEP